ncbi:MAG: cytochrome c biogenesis protein ResB [Actinobacteria bacterium]|nr:cytochrome c biogenesis protein ResB [Actinomycetota bacterium]
MRVLLRPVRIVWRRLTSMRTALILLFLLAVAAVPGSLLPQRPLNPDKVNSYITSHGVWGQFLNSIGMFDVFGSPWFAAIYLLLFVSLIGCLIPRIRVHARGVVRKPLPAPRNLDRLPESNRFETTDDPATYAAAARAALGRRWRIAERAEPSGAITLSAEKGYSRETGNLMFHVALLVALVLIAVGRLYSYEGQVIVSEGQGFCNTVTQYDSWKPGRFAAEGDVRPAPFCITDLRKFTATYTSQGEATQFRADVSYKPSVDAPVRNTSITVNNPLRLEGDRVYLINHGYAPKITVRMPDGSVISDSQPFIPSNATTLLSEGAFSEPGPAGADKDIGISGLFAPTPVDLGGGKIGSQLPQATNPELSIFIYEGDLNGNGEQHTVYTLDTSKMHQIGTANLKVGETKRLPNGVTVTFDGWGQWAGMQVSHDPAQTYLLLTALVMVIGLLGSLGVRRRRLWLRIAPADSAQVDSPTVVSVGGLASSDSGNFTTEFTGLVTRLEAAATPARPVVLDDAIGAGKD